MSAKEVFASVAYTCKHCHQPGVARFSTACDQDWLDRLHPLLIHDRCAVALSGFTRAGDALVHACMTLAHRSEGFERVAQRLDALARRYSQAFAERWGTPLLYADDFTAMLRERPERVGEILAQYRKQCLSLAQPAADARMADA